MTNSTCPTQVKNVNIVMYHYVRNLSNSRYKKIKGLDVKRFKKQISFLKQKFNIISTIDLLEAIYSNKNLPDNTALLTFDDGYIDHYTYVYPILKTDGLTGFFSMPGKIIVENSVLDVNKIHFILASTSIENIKKHLFDCMDYYRGNEYYFPDNEYLYNNIDKSSRFDDADTVFVKKILQVELEESLRNSIVDDLFSTFVQVPENSFAEELYMNMDQVKLMKNSGMYFGIHGYDHYWLNRLKQIDMENDINKALKVFSGIVETNSWVMCYPYGSYNDNLVSYIRQNGCVAGFTTEAKVAQLPCDEPLILPRLDTNDF